MRLIKMLGLAAIAALAAMAFVGAGSASADVLCLENVSHSSECGEPYEGDVLGLSSNAVLLNSSLGNLEVCHSTVLGTNYVAGDPHEPLEVLATIAFKECEGICTTANPDKPALLLGEASSLMAWIQEDPEKGVPSATLTGCPFGLTCLYDVTATIGGGEQLLTIAGDTITANHVPLTKLSGVCPSETFWDATYLVTEDDEGVAGEPLYITLE